MIKHTPGPWAWDTETQGILVRLDADGEWDAVIFAALDDVDLAQDYVSGGGKERVRWSLTDADARLIAAAPDSHEANVMFLEALKSLCGITPEWDDDRIYDELPSSELALAYFAARAAIAKATGEST